VLEGERGRLEADRSCGVPGVLLDAIAMWMSCLSTRPFARPASSRRAPC